jgi:hypothetical protein
MLSKRSNLERIGSSVIAIAKTFAGNKRNPWPRFVTWLLSKATAYSYMYVYRALPRFQHRRIFDTFQLSTCHACWVHVLAPLYLFIFVFLFKNIFFIFYNFRLFWYINIKNKNILFRYFFKKSLKDNNITFDRIRTMITHVYDLSSLACRRWEMYQVVVGGGEGTRSPKLVVSG